MLALNAVLIRVLKLPSIIATLGTLSILEGAALLLRDHPEGPISSGAVDGLTKSVSFVPIAFVAVDPALHTVFAVNNGDDTPMEV